MDKKHKFTHTGDNYKFTQNKNCEYFPCHKTEDPENFNCLFCYCPLYMMGSKCGGNFTYTAKGIKNCTPCIIPHIKDIGYNHIQSKMKTVMKIVQTEHLNEIKDENKNK